MAESNSAKKQRFRTAAAAAAAAAAAEDYQIVWPPVVVIENTITGRHPSTKMWTCLGNEEIRRFLKAQKDHVFERVMAVYDRNGARGKSLVVFSASPEGYRDAKDLSDHFYERGWGRSQWEKVRRLPHNNEARVTRDGRRILYGYLATEDDMNNADFNRQIVKRWSMESYFEKVWLPMREIEQKKELARRERTELSEELIQKTIALEHKKSEFGKAEAALREVDAEVLKQKRVDEELHAMYQRRFVEQKTKYETEIMAKFDALRRREIEFRNLLEQRNAEEENVLKECLKETQKLQDEIDTEKRNLQLRQIEQRQIEAMEIMKLDSLLQLKMEEELATREKAFREKEYQLRERHNEEIMKCRETMAAKREELLQKQMQQLELMESELKEAKSNSQQKQEEAQLECIICFAEFGKEVMERAYFSACSHALVCVPCAQDLWSEAKKRKREPECPTCKTVQKKKYQTLPARIYS